MQHGAAGSVCRSCRFPPCLTFHRQDLGVDAFLSVPAEKLAALNGEG